MSIRCWVSTTLTAAALAACMAANPVAAKLTDKDAARCSALGNLSIHAMEYKAKGVPLKEAIDKAETLFEGEELRHVITAIKAGYTAKPFATDLQVGTATFDKCMAQARLSTA